ncbi:hypothetical protein PVK06_011710 [Gossypium arboreum]|uniref:Uncharacterized protein n=1 Tax=Gossypium arboreum TaxID=29729 RepID=A0ABR0Q9M8_GOSAR|nr:hypothetical protein PVK06_011710 [Gossypium arboreum]
MVEMESRSKTVALKGKDQISTPRTRSGGKRAKERGSLAKSAGRPRKRAAAERLPRQYLLNEEVDENKSAGTHVLYVGREGPQSTKNSILASIAVGFKVVKFE